MCGDPVLVFEDINLWTKKELVPTDIDFLVSLGQADIKRIGTDVTTVAIAGSVPKAIAAAEALSKEGISAEVVDPRTLVPLDTQTLLHSVAKTGRVVIVDNSHRVGSVASEIAAVIAEQGFESLQRPIQRVTTPHVHVPFSPTLQPCPAERRDFPEMVPQSVPTIRIGDTWGPRYAAVQAA